MIVKNLKNFESLSRRTVRVIWYRENSRLDAIRELLANAVESGYIKAMDSDTAPRHKNIFHIGLNLSFAKFPIYSVGEVNKLGKI